ncbi:MAG: phospholipid scramblase-related protein, partial [Acidimicrobiales bacterium]
AKLIELTNEYAIHDQEGKQIGMVRQVGQSGAKKALRLLSNMDQFMTHKLEVLDERGQVCLNLTRPAKVMKSKIQVTNGHFQEIGSIVQQNMVGKIRFGLESGGSTYGTINAENWRAWNFAIQDHTGAEVASITKTWEGMATTLFTTADNFVVQIHRQLEEPLRSLVVASALCVDVALKQDDRGFN